VLRQRDDVTAKPERPDNAETIQDMRDQALVDLMDGVLSVYAQQDRCAIRRQDRSPFRPPHTPSYTR